MIAPLSVLDGGFVDLGTPNDGHVIGQDADGNFICRPHISTQGLFRDRNKPAHDGPLHFEREPYPERINEYETKVEVHLNFDRRTGLWRWWTTTPFDEPSPPTDIPRDGPPPDPPPPADPPPPTTPPPTTPPGIPGDPRDDVPDSSDGPHP